MVGFAGVVVGAAVVVVPARVVVGAGVVVPAAVVVGGGAALSVNCVALDPSGEKSTPTCPRTAAPAA